MRNILLTISILFCHLISSGDPILVGLHYGSSYLRATISVSDGSYIVRAGGTEICRLEKGETADITASEGKINLFHAGKNHTGLNKVEFEEIRPSLFKIQPAGHKANSRQYEQDLIAFSYNGRLQLVNRLELEDYVSGVIEAESGKDHELEYYKVQAVISRTYALNNKVRHSVEGFELCDATHCQVYHGIPKSEPLAEIATVTTRDIVIVDHQIDLITAAFHSNCGGRTINAEDVWTKPVSYLIGRRDTFCINMPHSTWEKSIPRDKWHNYIQNKKSDIQEYGQSGSLSVYQKERLMFCVDSCLWIPLRTMREDLKLRSTSFTMNEADHEVVFMGQGFGHGVGLCQEGAMRMATLDYCYEDIIHFYYRDVHLIPRYMMWFFKE